jgi:DNA-binding transcriptional ArsR family regulator
MNSARGKSNELARNKLVLLKLADNANDEGVCWPSVPLIADHTELSIRTVQEHLHRLEAKGLLRIERRQVNGLNMANIYHLQLAPPATRRKAAAEKPMARSGAAAAPVVQDQHQGGAGDAPGVVQLTASHIEEPPIEPPLNLPSHGPAGRVRRGLGEDLFKLLKAKDLPDVAMAILDGVEYQGAGVFTIVRPFQRTFLEGKFSGSALERACGAHPTFQLVPDVRKVS